MTPSTALRSAAPAGLTFRDLLIECYGGTPNSTQRHDLLREMEKLEQDGSVVFRDGTDQYYWRREMLGL